MIRGISTVNAAAQHRNRSASRVESGLMRYAVDAPRHAAHHGEAKRHEAAAEISCHSPTIVAGAARTDDSNGFLIMLLPLPLSVEYWRRICDATQPRRIVGIEKRLAFGSGLLCSTEFFGHSSPLRKIPQCFDDALV